MNTDENSVWRKTARAIAENGYVAKYFAHAIKNPPDKAVDDQAVEYIQRIICQEVARDVADPKVECQPEPATIGVNDTWMLAARRLLEDGELSRHLHARESATDSEHDKDLIQEENRVARHVAALLYGYFPVPEAVRHRRSIDEGDAAQLLAALVPHVERVIEAEIRPGYANIPSGGSLVVRAFTAERLLANESNPTENQDEQLLLLQNYLALHKVVCLLEAVERDPQCVWRIASGRAT